MQNPLSASNWAARSIPSTSSITPPATYKLVTSRPRYLQSARRRLTSEDNHYYAAPVVPRLNPDLFNTSETTRTSSPSSFSANSYNLFDNDIEPSLKEPDSLVGNKVSVADPQPSLDWITNPFSEIRRTPVQQQDIVKYFDQLDLLQHEFDQERALSEPIFSPGSTNDSVTFNALESLIDLPDLTALDEFLGEALAFTMDVKSASEWKNSFRSMREKFAADGSIPQLRFSSPAPSGPEERGTLPRRSSQSSGWRALAMGLPATFEDVDQSLGSTHKLSQPHSNGGGRPSGNLLSKSRSAADVSSWVKQVQEQHELTTPNGEISSGSTSSVQRLQVVPRVRTKSPMSDFWTQSVDTKPGFLEPRKEQNGSPLTVSSRLPVESDDKKHMLDSLASKLAVPHGQITMRVNGTLVSPSGSEDSELNLAELNSLIEESESSYTGRAPWMRHVRKKSQDANLISPQPYASSPVILSSQTFPRSVAKNTDKYGAFTSDSLATNDSLALRATEKSQTVRPEPVPLMDKKSNSVVNGSTQARDVVVGAGLHPDFEELDQIIAVLENKTNIKQRAGNRPDESAQKIITEASSFLQNNVETGSKNKFPVSPKDKPFDLRSVEMAKMIEHFERRSPISHHHGRSRSKSSSPEDELASLPHPKPKHHLLRDHALHQQALQEDMLKQGMRPVSPFLSTGSVAERVQLFEKAPPHMRKESLYRTLRPMLQSVDIVAKMEAIAMPNTSVFSAANQQVQREKDDLHVLKERNLIDSPLAKREHFESSPESPRSAGQRPASSLPQATSGSSSPHTPKSNLLGQFNNAAVTTSSPSATRSAAVHRVGGTPSQQHELRKQGDQVPRFYYPKGKPRSQSDMKIVMNNVQATFSQFADGRVQERDMAAVMKAAELPLYWKRVVFLKCGGTENGSITFHMFSESWLNICKDCHDDAARFVKLLAKEDRSYLVFDDFLPLVQDVVDSHPGLSFLRDAAEFHSRYTQTVIARIFFNSSRPWSYKITAAELRKSNFLDTLKLLEVVEDINTVTQYFSYEHFYVIYCKFWELDRDHDLLISKRDLERHNDYAINVKIIDQVISGAVTTGRHQKDGKMTYREFVWFLIAEEDKRHPTSVEYWFRCMDRDGDGVLSLEDLEYFYQEQMRKLEARGTEPIQFVDIACQLLDVVKPRTPNRIQLADLKRCKMGPQFLNTFINVEKYLEAEQQESGGAMRLDDSSGEMSDWDRFAMEEYEALVQEETGNLALDETNIDLEDDLLGAESPLSKSAPEMGIRQALAALSGENA